MHLEVQLSLHTDSKRSVFACNMRVSVTNNNLLSSHPMLVRKFFVRFKANSGEIKQDQWSENNCKNYDPDASGGLGWGSGIRRRYEGPCVGAGIPGIHLQFLCNVVHLFLGHRVKVF